MKANPNNYDAWFDYLRLVESEGNLDIIRETYERAIANVPPTKVSDLILLPVVLTYVAESVLRSQSVISSLPILTLGHQMMTIAIAQFDAQESKGRLKSRRMSVIAHSCTVLS